MEGEQNQLSRALMSPEEKDALEWPYPPAWTHKGPAGWLLVLKVLTLQGETCSMIDGVTVVAHITRMNIAQIILAVGGIYCVIWPLNLCYLEVVSF